jgi:CTP synthase
VNNKFREILERHGLHVVGEYEKERLAEIIELRGHPWFIGVQFHPEFKSRPLQPHPLFVAFIKAAKLYSKKIIHVLKGEA